jgi:hypothetical protein
MDQFDVHRLRAASESDEAPELVVILQHGHARAVDTVIVAVGSLESHRDDLMRAIDILFIGF